MALSLSWPAASLFGVAWDKLELDDVRRFLTSAGGEEHEGLTWEAKAGQIRPQHIHRAVSAFANSVLGGYLILGAERAGPRDPWMVPGCEIPGREPRSWIAQVAAEPIGAPTTDSHAWEVGSGKWVAVVSIPPSSVPPVISPSGVVYERVVGASPPVKDPSRLAQIFARGEAAQKRAISAASSARIGLSYQEGDLFANVSLGLASTGTPPDVRAAVFTSATQRAFEAAVMRDVDAQYVTRVDVSGTPHSLRVERVVQHHPGGPLIEANVNGGIVVALREPAEQYVANELPHNPWRLRQAWALAHEASAAIGGYGPAYLTCYIHGHPAAHYQGWTRGEGPTEDELAAIVRHVQRAGGAIVHEDG